MKILYRNPFLKIVFVSVFLFLFFYIPERQTQNNSLNLEGKKQSLLLNSQIWTVESQQKRPEQPIRLRIPVINVDANLQQLGITDTGQMEIPSNAVDAGWFKLGPRPGEKGSAVLAGHFDGERGEAGVFINLLKLKKGDKLYSEDSSGISTVFVVRESRLYNPGFADEVFNNNDGYHLNIITCDGVWDGTKKSYTKRLVVFADLET